MGLRCRRRSKTRSRSSPENRVRIMAAGRTDSGVHALGQVANFRTDCRIPCEKIRRGLQNFLPPDVVVLEAAEVPDDFHATYSAISNRYRYVIHQSPVRSPFLERYVWSRSDRLDAQAMQSAADCLLGTHDFRCFESQFPNKATSVRTVLGEQNFRGRRLGGVEPAGRWEIQIRRAKTAGPFLCFEIVADGFLYNMVRAIVGTLIKVGRGQWAPEEMREIIANQDRAQAGETAPAQGLYLVSVEYGDGFQEDSHDAGV